MWGTRGAERVPFNIAPRNIEHDVIDDLERVLQWPQ